jgi:ferritin-like metal-binding protein YciE
MNDLFLHHLTDIYYAEKQIPKMVKATKSPELAEAEEPAILARIRWGKHIEHYETVRQRKDGTYRHFADCVAD